MIRDLRKGRSSVYLNHQYTGHSIVAEKYQFEISNGKAILYFALRPAGISQKDDEQYLHDKIKLISVIIDDALVIDQINKNIEYSDNDILSWELNILSRKENFRFKVIHELNKFGKLEFKVI